MSRFPKLTETFILYEMLAVERCGVAVEVYPLQRERTSTMHPEAAPFVARAHFAPFLSFAILRAQIRTLARDPRAYLGALFTWLGATFGSVRYFAGALAFFAKAVWFAERMREQGIGHVHAHFASHPAAAALVIHRLTGIPYSFTAHGSDLHRDRHMLREKVAGAAFVVAISEYNRRVIAEHCGERAAAKVLVLHCGVDTSVFQPSTRGVPGAGLSPLRILCTGTLHEVKGQTHLVEACRILAGRGVDFTCAFVGDGPDRGRLGDQVARAGLADRVAFLGRRTRAEVVRLLGEADVLVAPSVPSRDGRREGIPVAIMEGSACGIPVVASRLSGIPELVEDGKQGFLVPPGDAGALAAALETLHADPSLRLALGREGRAKVVSEFDQGSNAAALALRFRAGTAR
jgi:glycosyltransferase involved in cell wall biosynthesis